MVSIDCEMLTRWVTWSDFRGLSFLLDLVDVARVAFSLQPHDHDHDHDNDSETLPSHRSTSPFSWPLHPGPRSAFTEAFVGHLDMLDLLGFPPPSIELLASIRSASPGARRR
jgi:hypothetical protein